MIYKTVTGKISIKDTIVEYTLTYKNVKNINMSDTQMYMQTGNSITVKVVEEIFKNLFK